MRGFTLTWIVFGAASVVALAGCSKKSAEPTASASAKQTAAPEAVKVDEPAPDASAHGTRKVTNIDLAVYVDGVQKGVLRYGDLPSLANVGAEFAPRFLLGSYLKGIGVAPEAVKSIYLYDGTNRIASVDGKELAKEPARFEFMFSSPKTGGAQTAWDTTGLKNTFIVHEIRKVAVFVAKDAPKIDAARQCVVDSATGECAEEIPFVTAPPAKGTRVYVDGKLAGVVKRKNVSDALAMGVTDDGDTKLSLTKLAADLGAATAGATSIELVSGDDVVGRANAATWAKLSDEVFFTLGQHQHGKVRVRVPAAMQKDGAVDRDALVTSIHVYKSSAPMARELVSITDTTNLSAQLASNDDARREEQDTQDKQ